MEELKKVSNLARAIIAVMKEVEGIDKAATIGTGTSQYKGVNDKDVKKVIGDSMAKNGLCILPIDIQATEKVDRWDQGGYQKQSVFTAVITKYLLLHESGESQVITGYGHGVDSQDKSAGKATTYALKYALLYSFVVPTGKIDDADTEHSKDKEIPPTPPTAKKENKAKELTLEQANEMLKSCETVEMLGKIYLTLPGKLKIETLKLKDELKEFLTPPKTETV